MALSWSNIFTGQLFLAAETENSAKKSILTTQQNGNRTAEAAVVG